MVICFTRTNHGCFDRRTIYQQCEPYLDAPINQSSDTDDQWERLRQRGHSDLRIPPTGSNVNSNSSYLTFVSSSKIQYEINNASDTGTRQVRVNNPDGQSSSYKSFTVAAAIPAPTISSLSPTTMPGSTSRQTLTINGSNFVSGATLTFNPPTGSNINSSSGYLSFVSSSQIRYEINNAGDAKTLAGAGQQSRWSEFELQELHGHGKHASSVDQQREPHDDAWLDQSADTDNQRQQLCQRSHPDLQPTNRQRHQQQFQLPDLRVEQSDPL